MLESSLPSSKSVLFWFCQQKVESESVIGIFFCCGNSKLSIKNSIIIEQMLLTRPESAKEQFKVFLHYFLNSKSVTKQIPYITLYTYITVSVDHTTFFFINLIFLFEIGLASASFRRTFDTDDDPDIEAEESHNLLGPSSSSVKMPQQPNLMSFEDFQRLPNDKQSEEIFKLLSMLSPFASEVSKVLRYYYKTPLA